MPALPIILFERAEDKSFLQELLKVSGLSDKFVFHNGNGGGKDGFELVLKGLVTVNHRTIIIVADNDGDPAEAFKNIQKQISAAGFTVPGKPREMVATADLSPLSVLMIPWDNESGCLETLCLGAVNPNYNSQLACADDLVTCAGADRWDIAKQSKLKMRVFLSAVCKSDPNTGLRYAWSREGGRPGDIFPLNGTAVFDQIAEYFRILAA